ncbi:DUF445 domain-containing protein [Metabacillus sp. RGM 3146]|uniref:DUF445 domain-containing protein n=1 Tax=Metabacillus sp. RGM 3146 TaxID=3401092 RepID=UPI003B9CB045
MTKNKSKYIANVSLGIMAAGFAVTLPFDPLPIKLLQGGFEAGLVGGLADWFAVTALFRHPLNIPIPHTALLPKNRKKITQSILTIVERDWLNKESIANKINGLSFSSLLFGKIEGYLESKQAEIQIKNALDTLYSYIEREKVKQWIKKTAANEITKLDKQKMLHSLIDLALTHHYHDKIFTVVLELAEKKLTTRETKEKITDYVLKVIEKKAENSFFKFALTPLLTAGKEKIQAAFDKALDDLLTDLKDKNSENRKNILDYIEYEMNVLKQSEDVKRKLGSKTAEFLESATYDDMISNFVDLIFDRISAMLEDAAFPRDTVIPQLKSLTSKIKNDKGAVSQLESTSQTIILQLIEQNHAKIGGLVKENLDKLNTEELIDLMENKIGKELSWIRVNGSICGFIIGILLSLIKVSTGAF